MFLIQIMSDCLFTSKDRFGAMLKTNIWFVLNSVWREMTSKWEISLYFLTFKVDNCKNGKCLIVLSAVESIQNRHCWWQWILAMIWKATGQPVFGRSFSIHLSFDQPFTRHFWSLCSSELLGLSGEEERQGSCSFWSSHFRREDKMIY